MNIPKRIIDYSACLPGRDKDSTMQTRQFSRFFFPLFCLFCLAILAGCGGDDAQQAPPAAVSYMEVKTRPITLTTQLPGRTTAFQVSEVRPQVGGIIKERLFEEGTDVKAGDVLYQIDPALFQAAYDSAKAALMRAEATAKSARSLVGRYATLVKINGISKQEYDDAVAADGQARAEVASAKAALDTARINLEYTQVTAPVSGRIGRSSVTPGALVTANQATALATIQQMDKMYADVTKSSTEILRLRKAMAEGKLTTSGQDALKVSLLLEDGSTYAHEGLLQFSEVTVEESTGVVTIRAIFPNPERLLLPNMYVRAVIEEGVDSKAILIPQKCEFKDTKGLSQIKVLKKSDQGQDLYTVEYRHITLNRAMGNQWVVEDGLKPGELIIVEGLQKAFPGSTVTGHPATEAEMGVDTSLQLSQAGGSR